MSSVFKVGETYKTRGGWDAKILSVEGIEVKPVVVKHFYKSGEHRVAQHLSFGGFLTMAPADHDLMAPKRELFAVYDYEGWFETSTDKQLAFKMAASCKGKVIRFIEEGEVTE